MDYTKVVSNIGRIFKETKGEKLCIFIDGQWGVGKTYTIEKFQESNKEEYDIKYVSVFGRDNLKSIEKELIMQMIPLFNFKKDAIENSTVKIFGSVIKKVAELATGKDLDISKILDNVSVENISSDDNIILCIDDLERKSNNIDLKDLLGFIERASSRFNVILIGSSINFNENEMHAFVNFKEKIVDFAFVVDELSDITLEEIINNKMGFIDKYYKDVIINIFRRSRLNNDTPLNNLRIFKKYIDLVFRVKLEVHTIFNGDKYQLDESLIELCNYIIFKNYLEDNVKNKDLEVSFSFNKAELKGLLERIFNYEDYDKDVLKEYFQDYSEIQSDMRKIRDAYKLSKEEMTVILKKIKKNIEKENLEYFIKQKYVISLYDVLKEIDVANKCERGLFKIIEKLYTPNIDEKPMKFVYSSWNDFNYSGEIENYNVLSIINYVNEFNLNTYKNYLEEQLKIALDRADVDAIISIMKHMGINNEDRFRNILNWALDKLDTKFEQGIWKVLVELIYCTDSEVVNNFLKDKKNHTGDYIRRSRMKALYEELGERMYYEQESEAEELNNSMHEGL